MFGKRAQRIVRRVLIVEDEPLVAFDNEYLLSDAGFEIVATVDRVPDALKVIAEGGIDLVLCDIGLNGQGDGIDVARAAKDSGVRVLFAAGQCPGGGEALAVGCLGKPYSQRDLLDALDVIEAQAAGKAPKRMPKALTLFAGDA